MKRINEIHSLAHTLAFKAEPALFKSLCRKLKNELTATLPDCTVTGFTPNHFCTSGFIQHNQTKKICYVSLNDVRYNTYATKRLLYRTAEHLRDYTGGRNCYAALEDLADAVQTMLS